MDSKDAFDLIGIGALGAAIGARISDFFFKTDPSGWQIDRLLFFNRYGSFDFWGAVVGIVVVTYIYLRFLAKKISTPAVLDLAAAPLAFGQTILALGSYLSEGQYSVYSLPMWQFLGYLLLFVILKRLAVRKRHAGFFFCFYLVIITIFDMIFFNFKAQVHYFFQIPYELAAPAVVFILILVAWHVLAKRDIARDVKWFFGLVLLSLFRTSRMVKSTNEAGTFSRSVIFFPYYVGRTIFGLFMILAKEVRLAFLEFLYVFGLRRFLK